MNCKKAILDLLKRTKAIESINEVQAFIEDINSKQDKLVSGTNIKTVNGESILGTGDIATKAYHTFNNSWNTSSIKNLCDSMVADSSVKAGMSYYGKFTGSGLPSPLGQAEMTIEVIADDSSNGKSLFLTVFSADTSPYKWETQYVRINGNYPSNINWKAYQQQITDSNKISTSLISGLSNVAISGSYNDLNNKPTIPNKTSQLSNDSNYVTSSQMEIAILDNNGYDYVEIAGTKWATMNVGANSVTDDGLYFQWGDTKGYTSSQVGSGNGKKYFSWEDYKYGNGTNSPGYSDFSKYNQSDGLTQLTPEDDAAQANWGGGWRMPTQNEIEALISATNAAWTTDYEGSGVVGLILTSKTDSNKKLFFPSGYCFYGQEIKFNKEEVEQYGLDSFIIYYGSTTLRGLYDSVPIINSTYPNNSAQFSSISRYYGLHVRGVLDTTLVPKYATKQELNNLETDVNAKISSAYHHAGTKTVAQLTSSLLTASHEGEVYNITDSGTTTSDFIEGQGLTISAGANVGIARIVNGNSISYKFDLLTGIIDTSGFVAKSSTAGLLKNDGTVDTNTYLTQHQDISNKVNSTTVNTIVVCTQAEYDTLVANNQVDANTEYNIVEQV